MEKVALGWMMSNSWSDPPICIMAVSLGIPFCSLFAGFAIFYFVGFVASIITLISVLASAMVWFHAIYHRNEPAPTELYIKFQNPEAERRWKGNRIPISTLCELYCDSEVDFKGDCFETIRDHRSKFTNYKITWSTFRFLILQLFPNRANSSTKNMAATKKEIAEHYDRGNDFFASFLGDRMVYTCAVFEGLEQTLEEAQDNKMSLICDKLMLTKDERLLDIGCGWGTLLRHAAKNYSAKAVGVTLSVEGAKYCKETAKKEGVEDRVETLTLDYRDISSDKKFDKISSIEMAEHVGLENFQIYLSKVHDLLRDDGLFLMQVAGLRQGANWQDIAWGLFMSRYIFPGADASTPLNWYVRQLEIAGFEVRSVETIGKHYSKTLHGWYDNFQKNKSNMEKTYGSYICRLWDFFLAWSVVASGQGSATCYQILVHKNTYTFPREVFCKNHVAQASVG
jgi:cyclopropane fatty-acyl-phospholipid synthase-like methyltransferase